jgi:hypothetical protein
MTATMMILLGSSFITDIIGVHAIFGKPFKLNSLPLHYPLILGSNGSSSMSGAFIAGLIVPREGGLTIALTEKLEDMVAIIFLPLVCAWFLVSESSRLSSWMCVSILHFPDFRRI